MKLLKKNTDYAVRALLYLAKNRNRFVSSAEISEQERIPLHYMRSIMQILTKEGIVSSREGVVGGTKLRAGAEGIRVTDLIRMFEGKIEFFKCMFNKNICPNRSGCVLRKRIKSIENKIVREFEKITIGKLLKDVVRRER